MEISKAIKVILKTKANKELNKTQKAGQAVLLSNGYKIEPCKNSEQGYMQVTKNNRTLYISMLEGSSKGCLFFENENRIGKYLNLSSHKSGIDDRDFKKLRDVFNKIDYVNLFNKVKYPQMETRNSAFDNAFSLMETYKRHKHFLEIARKNVEDIKAELDRAIDTYNNDRNQVAFIKKNYNDFVKKALKK